ncbi:MAG: CDP-diacylglycerol--glycerol-3-phosphate 3-phosphatidyltransferase [Frankiales bacterium]|nr:CDP-diacylglycerol--glycerol-3-phosphate 3-phosphatidyltransferase [Frankiales bacterium]
MKDLEVDAVPDPLAEPLAAPLSPASAWNIANALTVFRLFLVPLFLVALFWGDGHDTTWRWVAFGVFFVASYTDRVDGQLARSRNLITAFGKLADPIADKALIGAALVGLSSLDDLPWLVTIAVLVRELGVTLLRFWVIRHGVIPASRGGKLKTLLQGLAIGFYVLPLTGWLATGRAWLMAAAVAVTLITGADYVARALRLRQTSARADMKRARKAAKQS